ncbi:MAG: cbb3-type cytochrome oxidase subunit 3 [Oceanococcus sp.]
MSDLWGHLIGVIIVLMIVMFLAVWLWAWRPRHKRQFQRMACIPMDDITSTENPSVRKKS